MHRFSWINEWTERADAHGNADGIDLIVPDWFYRAVLDDALVLTIDRRYFALTGGVERLALSRRSQTHAGRQSHGWRFEFRHLHAKSAKPFAVQAFRFRIARHRAPAAPSGVQAADRARRPGEELLAFAPANLSTRACGQDVETHVLSGTEGHVPSGTERHVLSGTRTTEFIKLDQRLPARLTRESQLCMNLTLLKLATAGTGEKLRGVRHDRGALPSGHAHPYRIDLA